MSASDIKSMGRMLRQINDPATKRLFESILSNIDIIKSSLNSLENPDALEWVDAELQNGWIRYSDTFNKPQYTKTSYGVVHVKGLIKSGTSTAGTVLFNLPVGYRPENTCVFAGETSPTSHARVDVNPNGDVTIQSGSSVYFTLDVVRFVAFR